MIPFSKRFRQARCALRGRHEPFIRFPDMESVEKGEGFFDGNSRTMARVRIKYCRYCESAYVRKFVYRKENGPYDFSADGPIPGVYGS